MMAERGAKGSGAATPFPPAGAVPQGGGRLTNKHLAATLRAIADEGWAGFYDGAIAAEMARFAEKSGGFFRREDFLRQRATWGAPLSGNYRGVTIFNTPPPTQGFSVLEMLNLIEPYDLAQMDPLGADRTHLLVQAKQIAYHDRDRWLSDPAFVDVPVEMLVSKFYAQQRGRLIDLGTALSWDRVPSFGSLAGDTVYVAAVDG